MPRQEPHYPKNVIPFPKLKDRLLDKGAVAIRDKHYSEAMSYFKQLYEFDPTHEQAAFGLAVCYVELGAYEEAELLTDEMLKKDMGNYYDVLKLHISVLIQRKKYHKVITIIQAVLEEERVPSDMAISLKQLEAFCEKRLDEPEIAMSESKSNWQDDNEYNDSFDEWLESGKMEWQWLAIQKARDMLTLEKIEKLKQFLLRDQGDPFLKSLVIKLLFEEGDCHRLEVRKYGETFEISNVQSLFYEGLTDEVKIALSNQLEHENPTLYEMALQIWGHFILAAYPLSLDHLPHSAWASACYIYTQEINGVTVSNEDAALLFLCGMEEIEEAFNILHKVETESTRINS